MKYNFDRVVWGGGDEGSEEWILDEGVCVSNGTGKIIFSIS